MEYVWNRVLDLLLERTNESNFNLWFKPIRFVGVRASIWTLCVPNRFFRDWIIDHYLDVLERTLFEATGKPFQIELIVESSSPGASLSDVKASKPAHAGKRRNRKSNELWQSLNPRFVFDTFVVGSSNEFAHASCLAVSREPGKSYNPLFIYGGTGLGKTHLLQAIGHKLTGDSQQKKVAYVTSEFFVHEMITSIATNQMSNFKRRFRNSCDVLLMDDIQFIAGKSSTQEEFFHTFNFLFESGKQIVVTSDQFPQEITALDERIRSRLQSGLVADIHEPDLETRTAILKKKAELDGFNISEDVLEYLAENFRSNVRELEGSLIRLEAHTSLTGAVITVETARKVLRKTIKHNRDIQLSCRRIQEKVCSYFKIKLHDMNSKSRARKFVFPRQIAMYLVKRYTNLSFSDIGSKFGDKDHSTVIASIRRIENLMAEDINIRHTVESLEKQVNL